MARLSRRRGNRQESDASHGYGVKISVQNPEHSVGKDGRFNGRRVVLTSASREL
jgi:hypothetical protein